MVTKLVTNSPVGSVTECYRVTSGMEIPQTNQYRAGQNKPRPHQGKRKYMLRRCGPPSQGWRTFLRNHAPDIAAMDLFVVPTIGFDLLYVLVIVRLARRDLVWINVRTDPSGDPARGAHHICAHPLRTSSPLLQNLIFGTDTC